MANKMENSNVVIENLKKSQTSAKTAIKTLRNCFLIAVPGISFSPTLVGKGKF